MKKILITLALFFPSLLAAQTDNTFFVKQFTGADVGTKISKALASCNSNATIPCFIIVDPTLAGWPSGSMPSLPSNVFVEDFRFGLPFNQIGKQFYADPNGNGGTCTNCKWNPFWVIGEGGQSLSMGAMGSPALSTTQPYHNVMLAGGLTGSSLPFIPLVEGGTLWDTNTNVETTSSGLANYLAAANSSLGSGLRVGVGLHGYNGYSYSQIAPGTAPYILGTTQSQQFRQGAGLADWAYIPLAETLTHGEADWVSGNATIVNASNPFTVYEGYLEAYQSALLASKQSISPTTFLYPLFISQMNQAWTGEMAQAQLQTCLDNPTTIFCSSPKYMLQAASGSNIHMTNLSYKILGEYYAKAIQAWVTNGTWKPLYMTGTTLAGSVVKVNFNIPVAPLVLDTTNIWTHANYGFEYIDASSSRTISSVALTGSPASGVNVTLSGAPGANAWLRYAWTCPGGSGAYCLSQNHQIASDANYVGGNIRDSDATVSPSAAGSGRPLYNWLWAGQVPIPSVPVPPTAVSASEYSNTSAQVAFSTLNISGYPITNVTATATPGPFSASSTISPIFITGMTQNTTYTIAVTATNAYGTSAGASTGLTLTTVTIPTPTAEWFVTGNYNDNSGNAHTATAAGSGTTFITDPIGSGVHGTVASLNGSGYATTTVAEASSYSECGWVYPTVNSGSFTILAAGTTTGDTFYLSSGATGGANSLFTVKSVHNASGTFTLNAQDASAISANSWYRACVTYDGTNYVAYLNGVNVGTGAVAGRTGGNMDIAGSSYGASFAVGYLHKVDYWSGVVLTPSQVTLDSTQN